MPAGVGSKSAPPRPVRLRERRPSWKALSAGPNAGLDRHRLALARYHSKMVVVTVRCRLCFFISFCSYRKNRNNWQSRLPLRWVEPCRDTVRTFGNPGDRAVYPTTCSSLLSGTRADSTGSRLPPGFNWAECLFRFGCRARTTNCSEVAAIYSRHVRKKMFWWCKYMASWGLNLSCQSRDRWTGRKCRLPLRCSAWTTSLPPQPLSSVGIWRTKVTKWQKYLRHDFFTLFWIPLTAYRYVTQEPNETGGQTPPAGRGLRRAPARRGLTKCKSFHIGGISCKRQYEIKVVNLIKLTRKKTLEFR